MSESLFMLQIRFTKAAGGGASYYRVTAEGLDNFRQAYADPHTCIQLHASNGTIHNFMKANIREFSDRPFDPNYRSRK